MAERLRGMACPGNRVGQEPGAHQAPLFMFAVGSLGRRDVQRHRRCVALTHQGAARPAAVLIPTSIDQTRPIGGGPSRCPRKHGPSKQPLAHRLSKRGCATSDLPGNPRHTAACERTSTAFLAAAVSFALIVGHGHSAQLGVSTSLGETLPGPLENLTWAGSCAWCGVGRRRWGDSASWPLAWSRSRSDSRDLGGDCAAHAGGRRRVCASSGSDWGIAVSTRPGRQRWPGPAQGPRPCEERGGALPAGQ